MERISYTRISDIKLKDLNYVIKSIRKNLKKKFNYFYDRTVKITPLKQIKERNGK